MLAVAMVAFAIVVIVHFWAYVVLGAIELSALKRMCGTVRTRPGRASARAPRARLAARLAETTDTWPDHIAPVAERIAQVLATDAPDERQSTPR